MEVEGGLRTGLNVPTGRPPYASRKATPQRRWYTGVHIEPRGDARAGVGPMLPVAYARDRRDSQPFSVRQGYARSSHQQHGIATRMSRASTQYGRLVFPRISFVALFNILTASARVGIVRHSIR